MKSSSSIGSGSTAPWHDAQSGDIRSNSGQSRASRDAFSVASGSPASRRSTDQGPVDEFVDARSTLSSTSSNSFRSASERSLHNSESGSNSSSGRFSTDIASPRSVASNYSGRSTANLIDDLRSPSLRSIDSRPENPTYARSSHSSDISSIDSRPENPIYARSHSWASSTRESPQADSGSSASNQSDRRSNTSEILPAYDESGKRNPTLRELMDARSASSSSSPSSASSTIRRFREEGLTHESPSLNQSFAASAANREAESSQRGKSRFGSNAAPTTRTVPDSMSVSTSIFGIPVSRTFPVQPARSRGPVRPLSLKDQPSNASFSETGSKLEIGSNAAGSSRPAESRQSRDLRSLQSVDSGATDRLREFDGRYEDADSPRFQELSRGYQLAASLGHFNPYRSSGRDFESRGSRLSQFSERPVAPEWGPTSSRELSSHLSQINREKARSRAFKRLSRINEEGSSGGSSTSSRKTQISYYSNDDEDVIDWLRDRVEGTASFRGEGAGARGLADTYRLHDNVRDQFQPKPRSKSLLRSMFKK